MTRAGTVALVGKPNAGKSTLLNALVGTKLSIVSAKPQSTRDTTLGILTTGDTQLIFTDTPGLLDPGYALQRALRASAIKAIGDADVILYIVDATLGSAPSLVDAAGLQSAPRGTVITVFNKADRLQHAGLARLAESVPDSITLSASTGAGVQALIARVAELLPESPFLYPEDDLTTRSVRSIAAELVRETALEQLDEEIPYSVACEIDEFREDGDPVYIRAVVYVERDSQKRVLVGSGGRRIKSIGTAARLKVEALVGQRVYLDLWVKVLPNWRRDPAALARLGFHVPG